MQSKEDLAKEDLAIKKAAWRLMPLLILLYLVAYIDRQNVSFAKLQMLDSLGMSEAAYGLGASLFFIGYLLFEVPSNIALHKVGARRWIARIMLTWGLVTLALAWTQSATMFYILRFLLGAAEAGLYPGVIYFLTLWFPQRYRIQVLGYFTLGSSLGNMLGAGINGFLLDLNGTLGLQGWQWVFLATGIPPVILTFVTLRYLPETPLHARFLDPAEQQAIVTAVARDAATTTSHANPLAVLLQPRIFVLAFFYMMVSMSIYGISYWLPTVVKGFGVSSTTNGLLNMIPWFVTSLMFLWLPGKLRSETATLACVGGAVVLGVICFSISTFAPSPAIKLAALAIGAPCIYVMIPCFWSVPSRLLSGAEAAAGIAAINALANIGGFFGQNIMPMVKDATGNVAAPMLVPAACLIVLGFGAMLASRVLRSEPARTATATP